MLYIFFKLYYPSPYLQTLQVQSDKTKVICTSTSVEKVKSGYNYSFIECRYRYCKL